MKQPRSNSEFLTQCLAMFEYNLAATLVADMDSGTILYANPAFERLLGIGQAAATGKTVVDLGLITAEERAFVRAQLLAQGSLRGLQVPMRTEDGARVEVLLATDIVEIAQQRYLLSSMIDITDLRLHEEGAAQLDAIVKYSDHAIITEGLDGTIRSWNAGATQIFGYSAIEAIGQPIGLIVPDDYLAEEESIRERIGHREPIDHYETVRLRKGGERFYVSLTVSPLEDKLGRLTGVCKIARDITEQKQAAYARNLIEASLDPLVTIDAAGKITDVNYALVKATGVSRLALIGTDFCDYFTEPELARAGYLQAFNAGFVADYPLTICHQDGSLTDVMYNATVYKDENGVVLGVFAAARDVTEQKWAQDLRIANQELAYQNAEKEKRAAELAVANLELIFQSNEKEQRAAELVIANLELAFQNDEKGKRLAELRIANYARSLIEASRDPLVTISPEGKITDMNEAMVTVCGFSREELRGTDFKNYFTEPEKASAVYQEVFEKGFVADYPLTIKDGRLTDVLFNGSVYKDDSGNVLGAVIVARDITEQNRAQKELTEAIIFAETAAKLAEEARVEAEVATLAATNAMKAKQQFLSNMSHEIRTPMNAIIGFTKVVLKTQLSIKQREYLSAIKISGDALIVLINDILDLAKVDAGKMTFEKTPFKLVASVTAMVHLFEMKIQEKNLQLIIDYDPAIPETLVGDPVRLHQVIMNLVSNAVKFTAKGHIAIQVRLLAGTAESVRIGFTITDTGIGIAPTKIATIFENFQQASSSTSRLFGGTGLGLAIVKQLVEQQGGSVSVQSEVGVGSTFDFELGFAKTDALALEEARMMNLDEDFKHIKVLVVEDMPLNQLLMRTLLDDFGFEREIASDGQEAIEKLRAKTYDIILMDLQMPVMNGFDATEYIRNTMNSKIPIIALTADVTTVDLVKCKAVGMNDYLAKPVDERLLYSKIIALVTKPSAQLPKPEEVHPASDSPTRCIDLGYLSARTKSNPDLMMEMIGLYLDQTPPLVTAMKKGLEDQDWEVLYAAVHKMIPSFSIMGIHTEFEQIAKKVQDLASVRQEADGIPAMVLQLEKICLQACEELQEELQKMKTTKQ